MSFTIQQSGTLGYKTIDLDGLVVAWTTESYDAGLIVALSNRVEREGLSFDSILSGA